MGRVRLDSKAEPTTLFPASESLGFDDSQAKPMMKLDLPGQSKDGLACLRCHSSHGKLDRHVSHVLNTSPQISQAWPARQTFPENLFSGRSSKTLQLRWIGETVGPESPLSGSDSLFSGQQDPPPLASVWPTENFPENLIVTPKASP